MTKRPILFNDAMVRAILNGSKTQTRRPVKVQLPDGFDPGRVSLGWLHPNTEPEKQSYGFWLADRAACVSPFGGPGDYLWVRECFCIESNFNVDEYPPPFVDGRPLKRLGDQSVGRFWEQPHYRATDPEPALAYPDGPDGGPCVRWQPSIHMPRWASRIGLLVKRVWVEWLQEISHADAIAEGCHALTDWDLGRDDAEPPRAQFHNRWDSIYAAKGYGSVTGPVIWGCEFERRPE